MANWRRGFFRLWVLLTVLWIIISGLFAYNSIANPYVPETLFTFNQDDKLEVVPLYSDRYFRIQTDARAGFFEKVGFAEEAPRVFYMAPNLFRITIRGKKFEAVVTKEKLQETNREGLVDSLLAFIENQNVDLGGPLTREEVRAAIPHVIEIAYKEPWVKHQVLEFAIATEAQVTDEVRRNAIVPAAAGVLIPPLVVLLFGSALGWMLSGFRRRATPAS